ncbi:uncharacterized protein LOC113287241 isoform X2 [Papaver somniferum]|nr:uncharacterized protein LOC113287241 isoform X2 [Papaver somniferum]
MAMKDMQTQMGQLDTTVRNLEAKAAGKLPSQSLNPRETVNAIELRSGKQVGKPATSPESHERDLEKKVDEAVPKNDLVINFNSKPLISTYVTPPPFPNRFAKSNKETLNKEILEIFKKIKVNIPLIEAIRQVPRYAKFLKELCTNKHKLTGNEVNELIFPVDFYVLDMSDENSSSSTPLLLGKPFMRTARTKIDVFEVTLTMEFDGEVVRFNISEVMRYPSDVHSCFVVEETDGG